MMRETLENARRAVARTQAILQASDAPDPVQWAEAALGYDLDDFQKRIMRSVADRACYVACRQSGKSTIVGAKAGYAAYVKAGLRVVLVSPSFRQSVLLCDKIEDALQGQDVPYNRVKERLTLGNGSMVNVLGGDRSDTLRGYSADLVLLDEVGFLRNGGAEIIPAVMPMITQTQGKLLAVSSPNGPSGFLHDFFHQDGVETMQIKASDVSHFDPSVISEIRGRLSPSLASQELDAEWVSSSSSVFDADALSRMFAAPDDDDDLHTEGDDITEQETDLAKRFQNMQRKAARSKDAWSGL